MTIFVSMEIDQDQLTEMVLRRCIMQTDASNEIGITNVHLNYCMRGYRNFGPASAGWVIQWLIELNKKEAEEIDRYIIAAESEAENVLLNEK